MPHPVFTAPSDPDVMVWRYMDFTKFVDLIDRRALFFSRADFLGDPFEGSIPKSNNAALAAQLESEMKASPSGGTWLPNSHGAISVGPGEKRKTPQEVEQLFRHFRHWVREWTFVNCWHANEHESAGMWKLYARSNEAIAVQTTFKNLTASLPSKRDSGTEIYLGMVKYIDYLRDSFPNNNSLWPFVHKRQSFAHELEVRAVIQELPEADNQIRIGVRNPAGGRFVPVQLEQLIQRVYVAPTAPRWFVDLTSRTCAKYGVAVDVVQSGLDSAPLF